MKSPRMSHTCHTLIISGIDDNDHQRTIKRPKRQPNSNHRVVEVKRSGEKGDMRARLQHNEEAFDRPRVFCGGQVGAAAQTSDRNEERPKAELFSEAVAVPWT